MKTIILISFCCSILSCSRFRPLENVNRNFELNNFKNDNLIRNDGYYEGNFNNLIFTKNNKVVRTNSAIEKSLEIFLFNYEKEDLIKSSYIIEGNLIKAYVGTIIKRDRIIHSGDETIYLNYEGTIKNKDTILNWRIVDDLKLNSVEMRVNAKKFKPVDLYFVPSEKANILVEKLNLEVD